MLDLLPEPSYLIVVHKLYGDQFVFPSSGLLDRLKSLGDLHLGRLSFLSMQIVPMGRSLVSSFGLFVLR